MTPRRPSARGFVLLLFFATGLSALVYQVIWLRTLATVFGSTTYATTTVLSAFMGGLALGSYVFGRMADRAKRPLMLYGILEIGIGVFALVFPFLMRGYDDRGRPICPLGYAFTANGFDSQRQRHKWFCGKSCLKDKAPAVEIEGVTYPPDECPYQHPRHPFGKILNVGETFQDGSIRLVRDVPVDTPTWKRLYHRARNASEDRNSDLVSWQLKRLPVYGQPRGRALVALADAWLNLTTLARLVREATTAARTPSG